MESGPQSEKARRPNSCQEVGWEERLRNYLFCVEWDVNDKTLTQLILVYNIIHCWSKTIARVQNIRRELAEKRFAAELNVEASWKFLNDVGCDATQINMDSDDGEASRARC